jgi:hypothetical protein
MRLMERLLQLAWKCPVVCVGKTLGCAGSARGRTRFVRVFFRGACSCDTTHHASDAASPDCGLRLPGREWACFGSSLFLSTTPGKSLARKAHYANPVAPASFRTAPRALERAGTATPPVFTDTDTPQFLRTTGASKLEDYSGLCQDKKIRQNI